MEKIVMIVENIFMELYIYVKFMINRILNWGKGIKSTKPRCLGNKIVILGNGRSQDKFLDNRDDFEGYDILCVNSFPVYNEIDFFALKPKYLCIIDPVMTSAKAAERAGQYEEYVKLQEVLKRVNWNMQVVTWNNCEYAVEHDCIKICNMMYRGRSFTLKKRFCLQNKSAVPAETVAAIAVLFAIVFGYKEVALFGIDHDDFKDIYFDNSGNIYGRTWHAYNKQKPDVYRIRDDEEKHYIYELFEGYATVFKSYLELEKLAESVHTKIVNYNYNSYADAFEKSKKYYKDEKNA